MVWAILRQDNRFLLTQQSVLDCSGGTWTFPGGKVNAKDTDNIAAIYRKLKEEVGLKSARFRKLFHTHSGIYHINVFLCDQWSGELRPACLDTIGVGWFTSAEMYSLDQSLAPFVSKNLLYLLYMIQHYDHHPNEWKEQWRKM